VFRPAQALASTRDLEQGDILADVPRLHEGLEDNHIIINGPKSYTWPAPESSVRSFARSVRVVQRVDELDFALVVSSSCDNYRGTTAVMLAPVQSWEPRGKGPQERWSSIRNAATSPGSPKYFYLPKNDLCGFGRSQAQLGDFYLISHELLQKYVAMAGTRRVARLEEDAIRHLQWQLGVMLGRNPRDDFAWPSLEDLEVKEQALKESLEVRKNDSDLEAELRQTQERMKLLRG
jgi:hypothetical protein